MIKHALPLAVSSVRRDEWEAQYSTAVSSQRAQRHVGISEGDYAMQFIHVIPPIQL